MTDRPADYFVGLDLGQAQDFTALTVVERLRAPQDTPLLVRHLERFPLGTSYPAIVRRVVEVMTKPPLRGASTLVIDATGVGTAVVDLLRVARPAGSVIAVTITAGDETKRNGLDWRVPKRELVGALQVLLQTTRLKVADSLPLAATLLQELHGFRVKITAAAHDTYGPWREGAHDDLVLAVALACWYAGEQKKRLFRQVEVRL